MSKKRMSWKFHFYWLFTNVPGMPFVCVTLEVYFNIFQIRISLIFSSLSFVGWFSIFYTSHCLHFNENQMRFRCENELLEINSLLTTLFSSDSLQLNFMEFHWLISMTFFRQFIELNLILKVLPIVNMKKTYEYTCWSKKKNFYNPFTFCHWISVLENW